MMKDTMRLCAGEEELTSKLAKERIKQKQQTNYKFRIPNWERCSEDRKSHGGGRDASE